MLSATVYSLITVPLKKSQKPGTNNQIDVKVPPGDLKTVENLRSTCINEFDRIRKNVGDVRALDSFLSSEKDREKYLATVANAGEAYARALIDLVKRCPKFGIAKYYMWSSSLCDKQEIAYDDYRYDLLCVYYNVAAVWLNLAHYVLCLRASVGAMAVLEKEAYRILLRAAGYFGVCRSLVDAIKSEPIAVVDVPIPVDAAARVLSVLETVSLAQAQEIGTKKAVGADPKGESNTAARLCHQAYLLYQYARDTAQGVATRSKEFGEVSLLIAVKCDICKALTYSYAASCTLSTKASDALWFMERANQDAQTVAGYKTRKVKVAFGGEKVIDECLTTIRRSSERITKINSLVHRAKTTVGTPSLPPHQILAQKVEVQLPAPLPPAAASSPLPPSVLNATETRKPT